MKYDFNKIVERRGSSSLKWDYCDKVLGGKDLLPLWVADMDFEVPCEIRDAIVKRADHKIYGYSVPPDSYYDAVINWASSKYSWNIKKEWISYSPGIVTALNLLIQTLTCPGEKVIVQSPVYELFFKSIKNNDRIVINNQLCLERGRYRMDLVDLEQKIDKDTKLLILCNPHNPVSRVWTQKELLELSRIVIKNNILVVSDEIHADIVFHGNKFTPFASLSKEISQRTVTCMAPSKTFNIAGLQASLVISENPDLLDRYNKTLLKTGIHGPSIFSYIALEAAYKKGAPWLLELLEYLQKNISFVREFVRDNLRDVSIIEPEGTYLMWIDFRKKFSSHDEMKKTIYERAKIGFNDGRSFGPGGEGFMRMNFGCPKSIINEALIRIKNIL